MPICHDCYSYIDGLGPAALAKAASYTTGSEWLLLWNLVVAGVVTFLFVRFGILDRLSARLERRGWALRTFLLCAVFMLLSALLRSPPPTSCTPRPRQ